ncbi:hypothetical protein TrRE_jg8597, partial [Triparma retinervis]
MKLLSRKISAKDGGGELHVVPELNSDVWHLFNLLESSDQITMSTVRKVKSEGSTGTVRSTKQRLRLTIKMKGKPTYDATTSTLRISGTNVAESSFVKMGAFHTFTLGLNDAIKISKSCWDYVHLERIKSACDFSKSASLAAVVLQQDGLAHVCLITEHMTVTKAKVETSIPKKRSDKAWGTRNQEKQVGKFYRKLYEALVAHVDFKYVQCVLVGGPGFAPGDWMGWVWDEARRCENRSLLEHRDRFVTVRASSGHKHAVDEIINDPAVRGKITETKASRDVAVLD